MAISSRALGDLKIAIARSTSAIEIVDAINANTNELGGDLTGTSLVVTGGVTGTDFLVESIICTDMTLDITGVAATSSSGAGGVISITGGAAFQTLGSGKGGNLTLTGGAAGSTSGAGSSVILSGGSAGGSDVDDGAVIHRGLVMFSQAAPGVATATATLTVAQMLGGIVLGTPGGVVTYTTPTGTALKAALPADLAAGDSFDLVIINKGTAGRIITLAGGADVSIEGSVTVDDPGADINSSGLFRFRYTTGNTFIAYRIS